MLDWNFIIKIVIFCFLIYADKMICMKRNKSRYECISIRKKAIIIFRWKFVIKRRCYFDNWNQEYVYLLDEWLGIKKHQHISSNEIENMCKMVIKKMTFNQVMDCYWNCISINTIYRLIKNQPILYMVDSWIASSSATLVFWENYTRNRRIFTPIFLFHQKFDCLIFN